MCILLSTTAYAASSGSTVVTESVTITATGQPEKYTITLGKLYALKDYCGQFYDLGTGSFTVDNTYTTQKGRMRLKYTDTGGNTKYVQPYAHGTSTTTITIKGGTAIEMQMVGGLCNDNYPNRLIIRGSNGSTLVEKSWRGAKYNVITYIPTSNGTLDSGGNDLSSEFGAVGWYLTFR